MALRAIGKRNPALNAAAVAVARRLAASPEAAARWMGRQGRTQGADESQRKPAARSANK